MTCDRPDVLERMEAAVRDWDARCDLDYRCPEAGRWPRCWDEYADWSWKYAPDVVAFLRAYLAGRDGLGRGQ